VSFVATSSEQKDYFLIRHIDSSEGSLLSEFRNLVNNALHSLRAIANPDWLIADVNQEDPHTLQAAKKGIIFFHGGRSGLEIVVEDGGWKASVVGDVYIF